jgi:hypothetical protein
MGMGMREMGGFRASQQTSAASSQWQQRRQGFDALAQALQAGDLTKAQTAYANLTSKLPSGATTDPNSPLAKIGAALQAGDLAAAQASLPQRQAQDDQNQSTTSVSAANGSSAVASTSSATASTQGSRGHHGGHHHHGGGASSGGQAVQLANAISSGDTSTAQSVMTDLVNELQQVSGMSSVLSSSSATGATNNSSLASAVNSATTLLNDPNFQSLEQAVSGGDAATIKAAWSTFISNAATSASTSQTSTVTTPSA